MWQDITAVFCGASNIGDPANVALEIREEAGFENSTPPLVFTSTSGCRASENFDISSEINFFPIYSQ